MAKGSAAVAVPEQKTRTKTETKNKPKQQPRYHVILWDDNDHSYQYVIMMLRQLFGYEFSSGFKLAKKVDSDGRVVCLTTTKEHAELKRDQIHAFGRDFLIERCRGSMSATIEPETSE